MLVYLKNVLSSASFRHKTTYTQEKQNKSKQRQKQKENKTTLNALKQSKTRNIVKSHTCITIRQSTFPLHFSKLSTIDPFRNTQAYLALY